jgi:hypothetical protein
MAASKKKNPKKDIFTTREVSKLLQVNWKSSGMFFRRERTVSHPNP